MILRACADTEHGRRAVRLREHLVPERQDVSSTDKFIVSQIVGVIPNHAMP